MSSSAPGPEPHDLLPFYVNGTLSADEVERFESHMDACADCRKERDLLEGIKTQVERHGADYFAEHPGVEEIVAGALGELSGERRQEVLRHLAVCATCSAEARLVRQGSDAEDVVVPAPEMPRTRSTWVWAAASFAAGVLVTAVTVALLGGPAPTAVPPTFRVAAAQRGSDADTISLPAGTTRFQLYFHVDLDRSLLPLELTIHDASGELVSRPLVMDILSEGGFVFLPLERSDFPDGEYSISVHSRSDPQSRVVYRARIVGSDP